MKISCDDVIAIVPPQTFDASLSRDLLEQVQNQYLHALHTGSPARACSPFLDADTSIREMDRLGFTPSFQSSVEDMGSRQLRILIERTGASKVLAIRVNDHKVQVIHYAINTDEEILVKVGEDVVAFNGKKLSRTRSTPTAAWLSRIAPNALSVALGGAKFNPGFEEIEGRKIEISGIRNKGTLPPVISAIQLNRIEHPDAFGLFDYEFSLFPTTRILMTDQEIDVSNSKKGGFENLDLDMRRHHISLNYYAACGHGAVQLSLFSPIGTTYYSLGLGACYVHNKSRGRPAPDYLDTSLMGQFGHRVFFSPGFFMGIEAEALSFARPLYRDEEITVMTANRGSFLLGWHVTDAEGLFLRSWRRLFE